MKDIKFLRECNVNVEKSLELFGDMDIYNETMKDFLDGIDLKKERLEHFKSLLDLPNYAIFAHSIKSDARYLGFDSIAADALKHEMAGKEGNQKFIEEDYDYFLTKVNNMIEVVKKYLFEEPDADLVSDTVTSNKKKKVIVVDDSPLITSLISRALNDKYEVIIFNDGVKARDFIINNREPITLLLDLNIPVVNGFEILEIMKVNNLFSFVNTSIITGDEGEDTIKKAFSYNIIDMLPKPFSVDNVVNVVEKTANYN